jgi:hypothetical protein
VLREAEVKDLHLSVRRHHDVGRLEVPVDQAAAVRRSESIGDRNRHRDRLIERQRPVEQTAGERLPFDVLHDEERRPVMVAHVVERADVRMVQAGNRLRFALEPCAPVSVGADGRRENLDGNGPIETDVSTTVDFTHPSGADEGLDLVGAEARAGRQRHGRRS